MGVGGRTAMAIPAPTRPGRLLAAGEAAAQGAVGEAVAAGDEQRAGHGVAQRDGQEVLEQHRPPRHPRGPQRQALPPAPAPGPVSPRRPRRAGRPPDGQGGLRARRASAGAG
jgi:hypothetical protein